MNTANSLNGFIIELSSQRQTLMRYEKFPLGQTLEKQFVTIALDEEQFKSREQS
jgi:hypothetical protein